MVAIKEEGMEVGAIERSIFIEAAPEVVYEVVSDPEHLTRWYVDEADCRPEPGSAGHFAFGGPDRRVAVPVTVVEAVPGVRFRFRWMAPPAPEIPPVGAVLTAENSLLVTFDLMPQNGGTLLRVTEVGLREIGWEAALLEHYVNDHSEGWAALLGRLERYVGQLATR
jgi:uncharacterized protein YndB with AHSA1/START domain